MKSMIKKTFATTLVVLAYPKKKNRNLRKFP